MSEQYILFFSKFCRHSKKVMEMLSMSRIGTVTVPICIDDKKAKLPAFVTAVPLLYCMRTKQKYLGTSLTSLIQAHSVSTAARREVINSTDNDFSPNPRDHGSSTNYFSWQEPIDASSDNAEKSLSRMFNPVLVETEPRTDWNNQIDRPQPIQASNENKSREVEDAFDKLITARNQEKLQSMIRR